MFEQSHIFYLKLLYICPILEPKSIKLDHFEPHFLFLYTALKAASKAQSKNSLNMNITDFEKLCSVSLSRNNVYACLICGKYFQV